jgi:hypothetical protein
LCAWVAGLLPALLGVTSLVFPDRDSALDVGRAVLAIAWGVVFVATAELTQTAHDPMLLGSRTCRATAQPGLARMPATQDASVAAALHPTGSSGARTPGWLYVAGTLTILLALVLVGLHLSAGGAGPAAHLQAGGRP